MEFINDLPGLRIGVAPFAFGLVDFLVAAMTTVMYRNLVPPGMAWWRGMAVCFLAARGEYLSHSNVSLALPSHRHTKRTTCQHSRVSPPSFYHKNASVCTLRALGVTRWGSLVGLFSIINAAGHCILGTPWQSLPPFPFSFNSRYTDRVPAHLQADR